VNFTDSLLFTLSRTMPISDVPFLRILSRWMSFEFDERRCTEFLTELIDSGKLRAGLFDPSAISRGEVVATQDLLFPQPGNVEFAISNLARPEEFFAAELRPEQVPAVAALLRWAFHTTDSEKIRQRFKVVDAELLSKWVLPSREPAARPWPIPREPGIYRREHASLAIRSKTTTVLLDPIPLNTSLTGISGLYAEPALEAIDCVAITHGHGDHWNLPSILYQTESPEVPVIVPEVPEINLLSWNRFETSLEAIGQTCEARPWGSTITVGDIEIDILPFYGEQPTRGPTGASPKVRNWGNTYRINTPEFSALVLVDGGADPQGDLMDVMAESRRKRGPADFLLSCLREFACPFFGGLEHYWACLPFAELKTLHRLHKSGELPSTTAGPRGTAALCQAAGARFYLPYANGFEGKGTPIRDIGWGMGEPSEEESLRRVQGFLKELGQDTSALAWNCGDSVHPVRNGSPPKFIRFPKGGRA
jgi:L-ascorbate metabolism protein UlaG (beta-lactamase superfamily)